MDGTVSQASATEEMKQLRVGIDSYTFQVPMAFHGIGIHTFSHIIHLSQHSDVELYYFQPRYEDISREDFTHQLSRFIADHEIDIFHLPAPMQVSFPEVFLERDWPVKLTATAHDIVPLVFADYYLQDERLRQDYDIHLEMLRRMEHILAVSEYTRQDLIRVGFSPEQVTTIGAGSDTWYYRLPPELIRLEEFADRFQIDEPFILVFSAVEYRKNALRTVEGFCRAAREENTHWQLVFVNETTNEIRDRLKQAAGKFGMEDRICFVDRVTRAQLLRLYNGASALAFSSMYEGFGLPILEAMQCGVPVMASNTSSMPEVVGESGIYVDPFDIVSIAGGFRQLFDDERRSHLSRYGIDRAKGFDWRNVVESSVEAFRRILTEPKRPFIPWQSDLQYEDNDVVDDHKDARVDHAQNEVLEEPNYSQDPVHGRNEPFAAYAPNDVMDAPNHFLDLMHERPVPALDHMDSDISSPGTPQWLEIRLKPNRFRTIQSTRDGKLGSYFSFTLADVPPDARIIEANLRVRARVTNYSMRVYELKTGWSVRKLRRRKPMIRSHSTASLHPRSALKGKSQTFTCELTNLARKWQKHQLQNHGVYVPRVFRQRPRLVLTIECDSVKDS